MARSALKVCSRCRLEKTKTGFHRNWHSPGGLSAVCKECKCNYKRGWHLNKAYGLTNADYAQMLLEQKGVCLICKRPETRVSNKSGSVQPLCVDHNHKTNRVRGLLCNRCNRSIGLLEKYDDALELSKRIVAYLEAH